MWPNFFIVGASKSGATSVYSYLEKIPEIFMSSIKEPHYFHNNYFRLEAKNIANKNEYLKLFNSVTSEKAIGEASTSYLQDIDSAKLIHDQIPNAKIIIILRDPCQRAFSGYLMFKEEGKTKKSFNELITTEQRFLESGLYCSQVKQYLDIFGKDRVKILIFEEFIKDPKSGINGILDFLEIDSKPLENLEKIHNPYSVARNRFSKKILTSRSVASISDKILSKTMKSKLSETFLVKKEKKPKLEKKDKLFLEKFYQNNMLTLQTLLERKLPWNWLESLE